MDSPSDRWSAFSVSISNFFGLFFPQNLEIFYFFPVKCVYVSKRVTNYCWFMLQIAFSFWEESGESNADNWSKGCQEDFRRAQWPFYFPGKLCFFFFLSFSFPLYSIISRACRLSKFGHLFLNSFEMIFRALKSCHYFNLELELTKWIIFCQLGFVLLFYKIYFPYQHRATIPFTQCWDWVWKIEIELKWWLE